MISGNFAFMRRITTALIAALTAGSCWAQVEYTVLKDLKTPLSHVFDPMSSQPSWVSVWQGQMPLPGGINEPLRKKIDAQRDLKRGLVRRDNLSDKPAISDSLNPRVMRGFEGGSGDGTPNDNHIAVSNDGKVISVLNTVIRYFDSSGTLKRAWNLDFFPNTMNKPEGNLPALTRTYDPRVLYDPIQDRFIVLYMHGTTDQTSFIVVGFSSSNDPLKPWNVYKIPGNPSTDTVWSDYPIVTQTAEDMYFTVNLLANGTSWEEGFKQSVIWQIRKSEGFRGDTLRKNVFMGIKYNGVSVWSICPVQNGITPNGTDHYFLSVRPYSPKNDTVFLHRISNSFSSGNATFSLQMLKTNYPYGFPSSALQPDTTYKLRTNDARVLSAMRVGNTIHYFQNSMEFNTLHAGIYHGQITNLGVDPVIRGELIWDDTLDFGYPAVAAAGLDEKDPSYILTFGYSSPKHFAGVATMYSNRYGEKSKIVKIKTGSSLVYYNFIPRGEQRWGDYNGIQAKYNEPGTYYLVGSYGKNNGLSAYVAKVKANDALIKQPVSEVKVFPVPATTSLYVEVKVDKPGTYSAEIIDMNGKKVQEGLNLLLPGGTHLLQINTAFFRPAIYIMKLRNAEGAIMWEGKIQVVQ